MQSTATKVSGDVAGVVSYSAEPAEYPTLSASEESDDGLAVMKTVSARSRSGAVVELPPGITVGEDMPSTGSILHLAGNCQPCAWFWRPGSCHNGKECGHCHLCPEGEIKARKRRKSALLRAGAAAPSPKASASGVGEPCKVPQPKASTAAPSARALSFGIAEPRKVALPAEAMGWRGASAQAVDDGSRTAPRLQLASLLDHEEELAPAAPQQEDVSLVPDDLVKSGSAVGPDEMPPGPSPSRGASLHGTGQCRPCAWYWRPGSCQNGENCGHCHLCGQGELKARKKQKQAMFRLGLATPKPAQAHTQEAAADAFGMGAAAASGARRSPCSPDGSSEQGSTTASNSEHEHDDDAANGAGSADLSGDSAGTKARTRAGSFVAVPPGLKAPPGTPSHGSSLHKVGNCWPCARFWQQGGCPLGEDCSYCHLCKEGEMRTRKHSKAAMMRLGLATPKVDRKQLESFCMSEEAEVDAHDAIVA